MSRASDLAYRARWVILIVGVACVALGISWVFVVCPIDPSGLGSRTSQAGLIGTPVGPFYDDVGSDGATAYYVAASVYIGVFLVSQWLFLLPTRGWRFRLAHMGRPMRVSAITAALMAAMLGAGIFATALEVPNHWSLFFTEMAQRCFLLATLFVWGAWVVIFFFYWRHGDRYTQWTRMIKGLITGSFLELFIAIPVQACTYKREQCYCARGSYTGLVFGTTVLLWAFGPGIVLLFMREAYRKQKAMGPLCVKCGYSLRGTIDAGRTQCPECGAAIGI